MKAKLPAILATLFLISVVAVALWQIPRTAQMQQKADEAATLSTQPTGKELSTTNLPDCTYGEVLCVQDGEVIVNYHAHAMCTWQEFNVASGNTHAITEYAVVKINGPSFPNWASLVIGTPNQEYYITGIPNFQVKVEQPDTCKLRTVLGFANQWGLLIPDELRQLGILSGPIINP